MSLASYLAAPPRVIVWWTEGTYCPLASRPMVVSPTFYATPQGVAMGSAAEFRASSEE
jgi:hypothetical protein